MIWARHDSWPDLAFKTTNNPSDGLPQKQKIQPRLMPTLSKRNREEERETERERERERNLMNILALINLQLPSSN